MKKRRLFIMYGSLLITIAAFVVFALTFSGNDLKLPSAQVDLYDELFSVTVDDQLMDNQRLPAIIDAKKDQVITLTTTLPDTFVNQQHLLLRSSLQYLQVYVDDQLIYENFKDKNQIPPVASMWNIITIEGGSQNKLLTLQLSSPYSEMASSINSLYVGDVGSIQMFLFTNYGLMLVTSLLIIVLSFLFLLLTTFLSNENSRPNQLLALFTLFLGFWMFGESRMMQFLISSQFIHGGLSYLMIASFMIPLLMYIKDYVLVSYKRVLFVYIMIIILVINFWAVLALQFFGIADFFETVQFSNILILTTTFIIIALNMYEILKYKNKSALMFLKRMSIIIVAGFAEFINFFLNNFTNTSTFILLGLFVFLIVQIVEYIKVAISIIQRSKLAQKYEVLAHIDPLTSAKNRLAFNKDSEELLNNNPHNSLRVVFFDLNNLKIINDTLGHAKGDQAIKDTYNLIEHSFHDIGQSYRVGGDEFACLLFNVSESAFKEKMIQFKQAIFEKQSSLDYEFELAYGDALYNKNIDTSFSDTLSRADKRMYEHKVQLKSRVSSNNVRNTIGFVE